MKQWQGWARAVHVQRKSTVVLASLCTAVREPEMKGGLTDEKGCGRRSHNQGPMLQEFGSLV